MAEKKRPRRKKEEHADENPTKEEYAVAKFLRFKVPLREGKLVRMPVQCFIASKAVDALLESSWGSKAKSDPLFTNRQSCVAYCDRLLQKRLFHRAERIERKKDKLGKKKKKSEEEAVPEETEKKVKKRGKKERDSEKDQEKEAEEKDEKKDDDKKKKEKKIRLNMHEDQRFVDGDEVYVWVYDPIPVKTVVIGLLMVFGAIGVCLFPLWPEEVRVGVYYISLTAAAFVGFILVLILLRMILFCLTWTFTFGKHHFWLLPNLTEDVGFFDSFKPLYKHDIPSAKSKSSDSSKDVKDKNNASNNKKKEKLSDKEESASDKSEEQEEFEIVEREDMPTGENQEDVDPEENPEDMNPAENEEENGCTEGDEENDMEEKKDR